MKRLIIATKNLGKFREIKALLEENFDRFYSLNDFAEQVEVEEDSPYYSQNAIKKARIVGDRFGMHTLSDDSGLEVDALGGRPGIHSSRYGKNDDERMARLLGELAGVPWERRTAIFKAYLAFYLPETERGYIFYGHLKGIIGLERVGREGFGYDPVFYVPQFDKYLAEMSLEEKNGISHRGKAIASFKHFLDGAQLI